MSAAAPNVGAGLSTAADASALTTLFTRIRPTAPPPKPGSTWGLHESVGDSHAASSSAAGLIFPGTLVLESMAQLAGAMLDEGCARDDHPMTRSMLVGVDRARFRGEIHPGDQIVLEGTVSQQVAHGGSRDAPRGAVSHVRLVTEHERS
ncbi:MAG: hypothetical protein U0414_10725 [Polyangiaceae bacterium]